eukprot:980023_1
MNPQMHLVQGDTKNCILSATSNACHELFKWHAHVLVPPQSIFTSLVNTVGYNYVHQTVIGASLILLPFKYNDGIIAKAMVRFEPYNPLTELNSGDKAAVSAFMTRIMNRELVLVACYENKKREEVDQHRPKEPNPHSLCAKCDALLDQFNACKCGNSPFINAIDFANSGHAVCIIGAKAGMIETASGKELQIMFKYIDSGSSESLAIKDAPLEMFAAFFRVTLPNITPTRGLADGAIQYAADQLDTDNRTVLIDPTAV